MFIDNSLYNTCTSQHIIISALTRWCLYTLKVL